MNNIKLPKTFYPYTAGKRLSCRLLLEPRSSEMACPWRTYPAV